jgi:hypothetical protein
MSSPSQTINDLMLFLRDKYRLNVPVLPFPAVAAALSRLWSMAVGWFPEKLPPSIDIPAEGEWNVPLPDGHNLPLANIQVKIRLDDVTSP